MQKDPDNTFILLRPYIVVCTSKNIMYWHSALNGYKGLVLLFGTYLAWLTRKVDINCPFKVIFCNAVVLLSKLLGIWGNHFVFSLQKSLEIFRSICYCFVFCPFIFVSMKVLGF